jgi:hypothetical protein
MDESYFSNRRFWVITAKGSFVASMKTCWRFHWKYILTSFSCKKLKSFPDVIFVFKSETYRQRFVRESWLHVQLLKNKLAVSCSLGRFLVKWRWRNVCQEQLTRIKRKCKRKCLALHSKTLFLERFSMY